MLDGSIIFIPSNCNSSESSSSNSSFSTGGNGKEGIRVFSLVFSDSNKASFS